LHIFDKIGINKYDAIYQAEKKADRFLIGSVVSAMTSYFGVIVGKEAFPREIDMKTHSLMLERKGEDVILLCSEHPTTHLRESLINIKERYHHKMTTEEITELVERFISFKPQILDN
jgi:hypothetical protein